MPGNPVAHGGRKALALLVIVVASALVLAACSGANPTQPASAPVASGARPSSPAVVAIAQPASGATVNGASVHIVLSLTGATIVSATTSAITPDTGHVHLYVDNVLVTMNYGLEQDIPVHPGTYVLKAEFVAADHAPFSPRVWSPEVFFTVK
ncbi:MAG: hypothetical protein ACAH65_00825 [Chloroflexota bacterium]